MAWLDEVLEITRNRLNNLKNERIGAVQQGDLERVASLDVAIADTEAALRKLGAPAES